MARTYQVETREGDLVEVTSKYTSMPYIMDEARAKYQRDVVKVVAEDWLVAVGWTPKTQAARERLRLLGWSPPTPTQVQAERIASMKAAGMARLAQAFQKLNEEDNKGVGNGTGDPDPLVEEDDQEAASEAS